MFARRVCLMIGYQWNLVILYSDMQTFERRKTPFITVFIFTLFIEDISQHLAVAYLETITGRTEKYSYAMRTFPSVLYNKAVVIFCPSSRTLFSTHYYETCLNRCTRNFRRNFRLLFVITFAWLVWNMQSRCLRTESLERDMPVHRSPNNILSISRVVYNIIKNRTVYNWDPQLFPKRRQ
jgi:hypothetical protein